MKSYDLSELNILVLEKNVLLRRLLTDVFSEFGVPTVFSTHDAHEAYNYFCTNAPDIVFCDWTPDLDGMGFVRQIRKADDTPNPYSPIVVVTANTELRHVYHARDNGMTEFLAKPISANHFKNTRYNLLAGDQRLLSGFEVFDRHVACSQLIWADDNRQ